MIMWTYVTFVTYDNVNEWTHMDCSESHVVDDHFRHHSSSLMRRESVLFWSKAGRCHHGSHGPLR